MTLLYSVLGPQSWKATSTFAGCTVVKPWTLQVV